MQIANSVHVLQYSDGAALKENRDLRLEVHFLSSQTRSRCLFLLVGPRRHRGSSGAISAVDPHSPPWGPPQPPMGAPMGGCGGHLKGGEMGARAAASPLFFLAREGAEPDAVR